ncbi:hypothetical protein LJB71_00170 [Thermomonas sp. S9]|uniref:hypothetical protein n=1 Tax=Thermomonas sp. S9 TaxID=2885203 RepID=UPI00216B0B72|nr:hypothetical protein [Thermomonas sp. S9]MCR6494819.1 hypothetical protein [Thermomonas sp. S9]
MIELVEAEAIGRALGLTARSVRRRAAAENWPHTDLPAGADGGGCTGWPTCPPTCKPG